jgi:K+-sensing histidine kinase KdpD
MRYGGDHIRISARPILGEALVELAVEDDGAGVGAADEPHLFEKFYRVPRPGESSRHGMGIGLTVAQGLTQAMGGQIAAGRSDLGGLAVRIRLPAVELPPESGRPVDDGAAG